MNCPECGTQQLAGARYCHQCGWDRKLAAAGKSSSTAHDRPAWKRWTMGTALAAALMLVVTLLLVPHSDAQAQLNPGDKAPDFDLVSLDGKHVKLSELKGKPVIINFWATWCVPCRREMPEFQAALDQFKGAGLELYGINAGESRVAVADFRDQVGVTFPILLDIGDKAQAAYKILPLPATFFIDKDGIIRAYYPYQMSRAQIEQEVLHLLTP